MTIIPVLRLGTVLPNSNAVRVASISLILRIFVTRFGGHQKPTECLFLILFKSAPAEIVAFGKRYDSFEVTVRSSFCAPPYLPFQIMKDAKPYSIAQCRVELNFFIVGYGGTALVIVQPTIEK